MKENLLVPRRVALWPLHPPPGKYETIESWVKRLAAEYRVSMPVFCRHVLGLERDKIDLLRHDTPEEILRKLEAGTGVSIEQMQDMSFAKIFQRLVVDIEIIMRDDPNAFASFLLPKRGADYSKISDS